MPLAVSSYELSVFIHVTAVVVGFGATFAESVLFPVAMKMGPRNLHSEVGLLPLRNRRDAAQPTSVPRSQPRSGATT